MKRFSRNMPLQFKLLVYFLLFGMIILTVLWVFQSFFLEPFYTVSKTRRVEQSAQIISRSVNSNKNVQTTIESVARNNSMSVYVYDSTAKNNFTLKYRCEYDNPVMALSFDDENLRSYYKNASDNGGNYVCVTSNTQSDLAKQKLAKLIGGLSSPDSADYEIRFKNGDDNSNKQNMVYADIIGLSDGSECFLIITSSISPLDTTVSIFNNQMMIVSVAFILLALIFSLYASRRIAKPISKTNSSAKELAKKNYEVSFEAKGYLEVEELNETLEFAKNELETNERLQRELIANISHDLRTPLTMITGYGEVMRDLPGENTPENIQVIIDEATRLTTLVNDLLDLSKLQAGAVKTEKSEFCLTDSIKDIFTRYTKLREQEGYKLSFEYTEDVYVIADELRISQVIYNLVNNAVNHCGEDKTVIVTQKKNGGKVIIEVTDHGEGIPADKLEYIWDRYYKVDKEHRRGVIGSGLGLSIVKSILDSHSARYGVRSTLGKGSTFWFELDSSR